MEHNNLQGRRCDGTGEHPTGIVDESDFDIDDEYDPDDDGSFDVPWG